MKSKEIASQSLLLLIKTKGQGKDSDSRVSLIGIVTGYFAVCCMYPLSSVRKEYQRRDGVMELCLENL